MSDLTKQLAILREQYNDLKFQLFIKTMKKYKRMIYFSKNKKYDVQFEESLTGYTKQIKDVYILKIAMGPDKYHLNVYYIHQAIKDVLAVVYQEKNVSYYKEKINNLGIDFPIIEYEGKLTDFIEYVEKGESIAEFYYKKDDYIYGTLYKCQIPVYINDAIEQTDSVITDDLYDDTDRLYYYDEIVDEIQGEVYHLVTFTDGCI
jgi:hypothetical protein